MSASESKLKFDTPQFKTKEHIENGDVRIVTLPVKVVFKWQEEAMRYENGDVIKTESGYIMHVLPNQSFAYNGQLSVFIAQTLIKNKNDE